MVLKIGRMAFANLFPIFFTLEHEADCSSYRFIDGVPSELNMKIRAGEIDVSPSSSIEYLKNPGIYRLIEGHSISSFGAVGSIFLFSRTPIEELDGLSILTSSQSETSVALLEIILRKFYNINCVLKPTAGLPGTAEKTGEAYLLIGDSAMKEALLRPVPMIYDLGEIWYRYTGLPSVFALWIARKAAVEQMPEIFTRFVRDLDNSKRSALKNLYAIAGHSPLKELVSQEEILSYWQGISYDFDDAHRKGLDLFRQYAGELGILSST